MQFRGEVPKHEFEFRASDFQFMPGICFGPIQQPT